MKEIGRIMGLREGADSTGEPRVVGYLTAVVMGHHSAEKIGLRSMRELQTLARALDCLQEGKLDRVGDLLMQRFKAIVQSLADGSWRVATELEVVPDAAPTLASADEQRAAAHAAYLCSKLDAAKNKHQRSL